MTAAVRVFEHQAFVYRRVWRGSLFLTFLSPALFLAAMGLGLGGFVDASNPGGLDGVRYLAFLAPGLLAATAMQTAAMEGTWPVMAGIVWLKTFDAMLATPIRTRDIVFGILAWAAVRLTLVGSVFLGVMFLFDAVTSPAAVLALVPAVLTGLAFVAPIAGWAATQKNESGNTVLFRFFITPLYIFSGTFFPIEQLPDLLEPIAYLTPLYHGVALARGVALGGLDPVLAVIHVATLLAFIAAGTALALVTFRRRLVK